MICQEKAGDDTDHLFSKEGIEIAFVLAQESLS